MNENTVSTENLINELRQMREQMEYQTKARHKLNNELTQTLGSYSMQTSDQAMRLTSLETAVNGIKDSILPLVHLADDLRDIKLRLIGDAEMKSEGLVQQHEAVTARLAKLEVQATTTADDVKRLRMERTIVFTVLGSLAAIIGFLKSTSIIQWLVN